MRPDTGVEELNLRMTNHYVKLFNHTVSTISGSGSCDQLSHRGKRNTSKKHKRQTDRTTRASTKINTHCFTTKADKRVLIYDQTISMILSPLQWVWQSTQTSPHSPATHLWCLKALLRACRATCVGLNVPQTHALTSAFPPSHIHKQTDTHTHAHTHTPPRQPALCSREG